MKRQKDRRSRNSQDVCIRAKEAGWQGCKSQRMRHHYPWGSCCSQRHCWVLGHSCPKACSTRSWMEKREIMEKKFIWWPSYKMCLKEFKTGDKWHVQGEAQREARMGNTGMERKQTYTEYQLESKQKPLLLFSGCPLHQLRIFNAVVSNFPLKMSVN